MAKFAVTIASLILGLIVCLHAEEAKDTNQKLGRSLEGIIDTVQFGADKLINFAKSNGIDRDLLRQAGTSSLMTMGSAVMGVILIFVVIAVMFVALYPQSYATQQYGRRKRNVDSQTLNLLNNLQDDKFVNQLFKSLE